MRSLQNCKKTSMLCLKKRKINPICRSFQGTAFFLKISREKLVKEYHKKMKEFLLKKYACMCYNKIIKLKIGVLL